MKNIAILYTNYSPLIDAIKYQLSDYEVICLTIPADMDKYDMVINLGVEYDGEALACHHSLLPAFDTEEPAKDAILSGVKVTGVTVYYTKSKKIIAQYPVFINNDMHFDQLEQELKYLEQVLFPIAIHKILNNEPIDIRRLLNTPCGSNCGSKHTGGCRGCSH